MSGSTGVSIGDQVVTIFSETYTTIYALQERKPNEEIAGLIGSVERNIGEFVVQNLDTILKLPGTPLPEVTQEIAATDEKLAVLRRSKAILKIAEDLYRGLQTEKITDMLAGKIITAHALPPFYRGIFPSGIANYQFKHFPREASGNFEDVHLYKSPAYRGCLTITNGSSRHTLYPIHLFPDQEPHVEPALCLIVS
ncbi:MAG: hypothetical protein JWO35_404 [Candidatus Saccharibacteria bacterium]|nr:hypothetical protein [Candidatus Saccharibacteria bacterium]